jgi:hypothetical protein
MSKKPETLIALNVILDNRLLERYLKYPSKVIDAVLLFLGWEMGSHLSTVEIKFFRREF